MAKRDGDLRLLKNGVVFGPTDREGLDKLLAAGRVTPADHVSVRNADWIPIADFLAAPAAPPLIAPAQTAAPVTGSRRAKGDLRVLTAGRVIGSLSRSDVEQLHAGGRIGADDLICAHNGPWMPVGDFLSPPPPVEKPPIAANVVTTAADPAPATPAPYTPDDEDDPVVFTPLSPAPPMAPAPAAPPPPVAPVPAPPPPIAPAPAPPAPLSPAPPAWPPPLIAQVVVPRPAAAPVHAPASYPLARLRPPAPPANDEWFVRVRGIHSAPLRKHHVKALYQAREITLDNAARHPTWHENDWRPIHSIPQLADIVQP
ncbi:MAG TPA: hypothetical protein VHC22_28125 [Pirellulales bacterium]|nr:hypothetical protein [Pirellulales bacterium]